MKYLLSCKGNGIFYVKTMVTVSVLTMNAGHLPSGQSNHYYE